VGKYAEVGDINRFEHPKQIQKLARLNLKENSSRKRKGKTTIHKNNIKMGFTYEKYNFYHR
jgi:transposase